MKEIKIYLQYSCPNVWTFVVLLKCHLHLYSTGPEKPGNISVTQRTNTLSISWILPRGNISYYQVKISNENLVFTNSSQTMATTTSFTYLKPGRLYNITVTAFAGNLWNTSDQVSFATGKPNNLISFLYHHVFEDPENNCGYH